MSQEAQRRADLFLFAALNLALVAGLSVLPPFDLLAPLARWAAPMGLLIGLVHGLLAWLGGDLALRCLALRVHPFWAGTAGRYGLRLLLAAALGWWLLSQVGPGGHADARALLWLQALPLLLWPAGLLGRAGSVRAQRLVDGPRIEPESAQHFHHDTGMMNQVDMGRGGHMADLRPRQQRRVRREHDVVARAEAAGEGFAA